MATDIKVTSLLAAGGAGTVTLSAYAASPAGMECLPYMQAVKIEFWVSTSNNRNNATKLGESEVGILVHSGLGENVTRYYWARAVDAAGNFSDFYPTSVTGGVAATTSTMTPGPNSIGSSQLQSNAVQTTHIANAAVTDAKIVSLSASKISAGTISASISMSAPNIYGGSISAPSISGGTISGVTINGGTVQTATSGNRVVMNGAANALSVYQSGTEIVRLGPSPNPTWEGVISARTGSSTAILAYNFSSVNNIPALRVTSNGGTGTACTINGGGTGQHAIIGNHNNGGFGLVGINNTDGGFAFYTMRGGYGPFTGQHDAMIAKDDPAEPGDIVFDKRVLVRSGWDDALTEVGITTARGQKGAVGVLSRRFAFDPMANFSAFPAPADHRTDRQKVKGTGARPEPGIMRRRWAEKYDRSTINSVGEGLMNVCGRGGDLEAGDLIWASDLAGKGERQPDDIVRASTVAKVREAVTFDHPDQVKRVAVIYLCG